MQLVPLVKWQQQLSTSATGKINMHKPLQLQFVEETMKRTSSKKEIFYILSHKFQNDNHCRISISWVLPPWVFESLFNVEQKLK